jgi:Flp pilus assembly protein TadG
MTRDRRWRRERGQSLVEFAIVLPILVVLLLGVVDAARLIWTYVALAEAAQEGALFGSQDPNPGRITTRVQQSSSAPEVAGSTVSATCPSGKVTVTVSFPLQLITPVGAQIFGSPFTVSATNTSTNFKGSACI